MSLVRPGLLKSFVPTQASTRQRRGLGGTRLHVSVAASATLCRSWRRPKLSSPCARRPFKKKTAAERREPNFGNFRACPASFCAQRSSRRSTNSWMASAGTLGSLSSQVAFYIHHAVLDQVQAPLLHAEVKHSRDSTSCLRRTCWMF